MRCERIGGAKAEAGEAELEVFEAVIRSSNSNRIRGSKRRFEVRKAARRVRRPIRASRRPSNSFESASKVPSCDSTPALRPEILRRYTKENGMRLPFDICSDGDPRTVPSAHLADGKGRDSDVKGKMYTTADQNLIRKDFEGRTGSSKLEGRPSAVESASKWLRTGYYRDRACLDTWHGSLRQHPVCLEGARAVPR